MDTSLEGKPTWRDERGLPAPRHARFRDLRRGDRSGSKDRDVVMIGQARPRGQEAEKRCQRNCPAARGPAVALLPHLFTGVRCWRRKGEEHERRPSGQTEEEIWQ